MSPNPFRRFADRRKSSKRQTSSPPAQAIEPVPPPQIQEPQAAAQPSPLLQQPEAAEPPPSPPTLQQDVVAVNQHETANNNNSEGTFNHVNGNQNYDTSTAYQGDVYEGDYFASSIQGGNVGGRGNTNAIFNGGSSFDLPRRGSGTARSEIRGLEAKAEYFQSEIDRLMDEMGLSEEEKLERKITELQITYRTLQREAASPRSGPGQDDY
ncbi:hypothetical protein PC9H_000492 [Pleurotus ostreatus]|uniref:Uncharacterized protein n=1 Tax=Pleurotus ostreatus TaxID=5322 RepID=A0A8H7A213_PLEOS|nr:uncharacterized protein PC9H_000492 [Pleurotus ostreatus]KAF7440148.1 hypothetical protein PC9H_000492 [Pleurotus ostreatus]